MPVAARMNDVRFKRMVRPGENIRMEVELIERMAEFLPEGESDGRWQSRRAL